MNLLFLSFLLATGVHSCKEDPIDDCIDEALDKTINQVIADINQTLKESTEFFVKYETNLHSFAVELESTLRADKIVLERLLKLKELHGNRFNETDEFNEFCNQFTNRTNTTEPKPQSETEKCQSLVLNAKKCENCTTPTYDDVNMIYTCTKGYTFDIALKSESRQVRCEFSESGNISLVYEGNVTSGVYTGELTCVAIPPEIEVKCPYSCAETAKCSESKLVCACLKGYVDVSSQHDKPAGSICTKCNNSDPLGTDYVMLYDVSRSIDQAESQQMINFVSEFLKFVDIDSSDNRFSLVEFSSLAYLKFPLSPKSKSEEIIESLKLDSPYKHDGSTNTPDALYIANDQVYAKLPADSTRPRVTILFTDGAPTSLHSAFANFSREDSNLTMAELDQFMKINADLRDLGEHNLGALAKESVETNWQELMIADLVEEVRKMRETHRAQIVTIYVGRNTEESKIKLMRAITSEDEELSVDNFEDLKNDVLDRLQMKIC